MHVAAETRFYGAYIVAVRILEIQAALMQTVVSQEWADWAKRSDKKLREEAAAVKALVLDEAGFWGKLEVMVDVFAPVVKLLGLVDSQVPSASKVSTEPARVCLQSPLLFVIA